MTNSKRGDWLLTGWGGVFVGTQFWNTGKIFLKAISIAGKSGIIKGDKLIMALHCSGPCVGKRMHPNEFAEACFGSSRTFRYCSLVALLRSDFWAASTHVA